MDDGPDVELSATTSLGEDCWRSPRRISIFHLLQTVRAEADDRKSADLLRASDAFCARFSRGGGDYLLNFLLPRVVTENIMRHGFAPEETPMYRDEFLVRR